MCYLPSPHLGTEKQGTPTAAHTISPLAGQLGLIREQCGVCVSCLFAGCSVREEPGSVIKPPNWEWLQRGRAGNGAGRHL